MGDYFQFLESIKKLVEDYMLYNTKSIENQLKKALSSAQLLDAQNFRDMDMEPNENFKTRLNELKDKMDQALVDVTNKTLVPVNNVLDFQRLGQDIHKLIKKFDNFKEDIKKVRNIQINF